MLANKLDLISTRFISALCKLSFNLHLFVFRFRYKEGRDWLSAEKNQQFGNAYSLEIERVKEYQKKIGEDVKENDLAVEPSQNEQEDLKERTEHQPLICRDEKKAVESIQSELEKINRQFEKQAREKELKKYNDEMAEKVKKLEEKDLEEKIIRKINKKIKELEEDKAYMELSKEEKNQNFIDKICQIIEDPIKGKTTDELRVMGEFIVNLIQRVEAIKKEDQAVNHEELVARLKAKFVIVNYYYQYPQKLAEVNQSKSLKSEGTTHEEKAIHPSCEICNISAGTTPTSPTSETESVQSVNEQTDLIASVTSSLQELKADSTKKELIQKIMKGMIRSTIGINQTMDKSLNFSTAKNLFSSIARVRENFHLLSKKMKEKVEKEVFPIVKKFPGEEVILYITRDSYQSLTEEEKTKVRVKN